jgi:hypothetical protein
MQKTNCVDAVCYSNAFEVMENTAHAVKLHIIFLKVKGTNSVQEKHTHINTQVHMDQQGNDLVPEDRH